MKRHRLICSLLLSLSALSHAQVDIQSDPVLKGFQERVSAENEKYLVSLTTKRKLVADRNLIALQPVLAYIDREIAFLSGDQSQPRIDLTVSGDPKVAAIKAASGAMLEALKVEQSGLSRTKQTVADELTELAKANKWTESRLQLGLAAIDRADQGQSKSNAELTVAVSSVKDLKITPSRLANKAAKVYLLKLTEGHSGVTADVALKIAQAKFPGKHVNLFGPLDAGGNLQDFYRSVSRENFEERFHVNAGWNMATGTLRLPIQGGNLTYQDVSLPEKNDGALVTVGSLATGGANPKDPKNIFVFNPLSPAPFWLKPINELAKSIVALVADEVPK